MEKILKLYTYVDGVNDKPFPNKETQVVITSFRGDYKRMGATPTITCSILHNECLDKLWSYNVYTIFNGEKFFIKQIPTSSYDNTDSRYKHELELVSERIILDNVYFYDVVNASNNDYKPVTNSSTFSFYGDIHEFANRLQNSLNYSKLNYSVVVDKGVSSEPKMISFEDKFFSNVLQEAYNTYDIPYYFIGNEIHIGYTDNFIQYPFKYGCDESLLSIQKQNANYKVVNRVTGVGSSDNIPYYYPNDDEKGESIPLYNGEEGVVSITNSTLYKKLKLDSSFTYYTKKSGNDILVNGDEFTFGDIPYLDTVLGEIVFGNVEYTFSTSKYSPKCNLIVTYFGEDLSYLDVQVTKSNDVKYQFDETGEYSISLNQGVYKINVWLKLATSEKELSYNEIINKFKDFRIYLTQQWDEGKTGWVLSKNNNEEYAPLENYGLSFNGTPKEGDRITFFRTSYIKPQVNLMPPVYRETQGDERFYNAVNNTYIDKDTGKFYFFENPYIEGKPKEHIVNFDHIKPSIVGMTNSNGLRIDMFTEFAYDLNDNDEFDEEGNYLHPYFFGKLRRMDGEYGFNLFDHSIEENEMIISMTSGSCGGCEFIIGVTEDTQKNVVQVDERGELLRDNNGNVIRVGNPQPQQNDTRNNEVWIALKKDINTFGVIMPNATSNYKPSAGDTFVILHIDLPKAYILSAENKLKEELVKYMSQNNSEKFNFSISFSRIFFEEHPEILSQLNENSRIRIEYDNEVYELYVSSYSYSMSDNAALPEIRVDLSDTITIQQNALQNAVSEVKQDVIASVGSINVQMQGFLRRNIDDRTTGSIATDKGIEVGVYKSGKSGAVIYEDITNGQTVAEFDKLYVRMKAYFETLEIINASTIGGKQIISPAGSVKCIGVEEIDNAYRCYFLAEQDGEKVQNKWVVGDQAYSQMFNAQEGEFNNVYNKYYWRLVTNVSKTTVDFESKKCHYIDLSKSDCDSGSDIPAIGDVLNQRGNRTDLDRMNFIEMSSVDAFSPNITLFHGVNSYSLDGKAYVSYGVDKSTNKAFMDVYGDMYVGDRQNTSYMRYTQENGLEISGTLSVGTKLGDTPLKDLISASSPEGYQEFVEKVTQDIEGLQAQIDGAIESYFFQYDPTLGNYPASEWIANGTEKAHLNDTFTNLANGYSWRWTIDNGVYGWTEITDTATSKALALAGQAKDTADGKRRVFVDTPYPPYDKGDLWSRGSEHPLMICVKTKDKNGAYEASDFDYADNNAKLKEEMQELVGDTKDELNNAIGQAKNEAVNNANAYTDAGKQALQASIDAMEQSKANLDDVYTRAQANGKISESETNAINAAKDQADAAIALSEITIKAYADGIVDEEEAARIKQAQENLDAAKEYAKEQAQKAIDEANDTYGYLAKALDTEVDGGLLLTSLIQMRDTDQNIMSGINGLTAKGDKSIATWWGGGIYDMFDYYDWDGAKWVAKKNIQIPTNVPSGVIRMDGTGYLAKGKFWWDESGKIYADPTALFLSFDVEAEAGTLSATIIDMRDKQTEFSDMWEFKTDANGRKYLLSKYPLVTQEGVTMYSGASTTIPSIYDGLPIDGTTIYWENGVLKAQGGGSEGINEEQLENYLTTNNYAKKSDIPSLSGYATQSWVASQGYITGITSVMITSALGFTPYNADNFTKAKIKSTLGISDWALAESKPSYTYTEIGGTPDLSVYALKTSLSSYQPLISTTNKLAYSLVSGTPTSLKNPTSLTFGSKTYDGSEAKTISASDLGALTSHQTIYALKLQSGTFSAGTYTPNSEAKTINIPTTTSHISESTNLYFTNARAVSALSSTLANYVTLGDSQTIAGAKNFTGGLSINGGSLIYNASEGYWKLEGNLLVTGGVAMYSDGSDIGGGGTGGGGSIDYPLKWSGFSSGSYDGSSAKTIYIPSKLSELTNDSGYALSTSLSGYLPLSGGTVNGDLVVRNSYGGVALVHTEKGNKGILFYKGGSDWLVTNHNWAAEYTLYHSGNFNPSDYLPLSGGKITRNNVTLLSLNNTGESSIVESGVRYEIKGVAKAWIGYNSTYGAAIYNYAKNWWFGLKDDGSLGYSGGTILHSNNYSSYALPLTGGTLTSTSDTPLVLKRNTTNSNVLLAFINATEALGSIGIMGQSRHVMYKQPVFTDNVNVYQIIHSGNIGSQSVSYASNSDKLDGLHANELLTSISSNSSTNLSITIGGTTKKITSIYSQYTQKFHAIWNNPSSGSFDLNTHYNGGIVRYYGNGGSLTNAPTSFGYGSILSLTSGDEALSGQLAWNINHGSTSDVTKNLYWRASDSSNVFTYAKWHQIAFTDSNVASATKLQTTRTIWGQSFDGSGNVSGNMTGVGSITMSSDVFMNNNMGIAIKNTSGTHKHILLLSNNNRAYFGYPDLDSYIRGNNINITYGSSQTSGIYLNSSGNVGIGTTSPAYKLDVSGTLHASGNTSIGGTLSVTGATTLSSDLNVSGTIYLGTHHYIRRDTSGLFMYNLSAKNYIELYDNTNIVLNGGKVGIGTTSPTKKVHIWSDSSAYDSLMLLEKNGAYDVRFELSNTTSALRIIQQSTGNAYISLKDKYSLNLETSSTVRFTIDGVGNVGIGTKSPETILHVAGNTRVDGFLYLLNNKSIHSYNTDKSASYEVLRMNNSNGLVLGNGSSAAGGDLILDGNYIYVRCGSTHTNAIYVNSSGNVGIGTTSPHCKLDVNGSIRANGNVLLEAANSTTGGGIAFWDNSGWVNGTINAKNLILNYAGGNVGIGTTNPAYKLDVKGQISSTENMIYQSNSKIRITLYGENRIGRIYNYDEASATYGDMYIGKNGTDAITIKGDTFSVGIGTNNPSAKLHVAGGAYIGNTDEGIWISKYGNTIDAMSSSGSSLPLYLNHTSTGDIRMVIGGGNVGIGTSSPSAKLHVSGNILATGSITMNSMRSLKNIVDERGLSLEELSLIKPTRFTWKDGRDDRLHIGGIADDVMKVLPEVVFKGSDGVLSMDYASTAFVMAASLIQPMTEHERRIANLERENALLKEEIRNLKSA